ncbi:acyltransferase family protein [Leptothrix sp. BB-4]
MKNHYPFVDFLRGIAALWVCIAHCMIWSGTTLPGIASPKIAVDLFMMISGFLMMSQVDLRAAAEPMSMRANWLRFYVRRYFRIAPAYYVSLALAVAIAPWFLGGYSNLRGAIGGPVTQTAHYDPLRIQYDLNNILSHITFTFGLHPRASFSTYLPDWSLSLEMQFYLLFPMIYLAVRRWGWLKICTMAGATGFALTAAWAWAIKSGIIGTDKIFYEPSLIVFKIQFFMIGIAIYELAHEKSQKILLQGLLTISLLVCFQLGYGINRIFVIGLALFMLACARTHNRILEKIYESTAVKRLSDYAYSVYLFHGFFIALSGHFLSEIIVGRPYTLIMIVVPSTLLLAIAVERTIEKPGIELGRLILQRLPRPRTHVAST